MGIDQSIVRQARQTDLPSYLLARGEPLTKNGNEYRHGIHNSLIVKGNMYCWNSKQTKGNSLNFMMDFYNMDFKQAIEELTGAQTGQVIPRIIDQPAPKVLTMPNKADNVKRVFAYLLQTRRIYKTVLQLCFDKHLLYQDTNGNAVFRMTNSNGEVMGAEIRGTSQQPFKGIASGSKLGYGFNIVIGTNEPSRIGK